MHPREIHSRWPLRRGLLSGALLLATLQVSPAQRADQPPPAGNSAAQAVAVPGWPFDATEALRRQEEAAKTLGVPKETSFALSDKVSLKVILIPAGKFMMGGFGKRAGRGGSAPLHEVTISKSFYLGIYPVTQEQYVAIMGVNPSWMKEPDLPVDTTTVQDEDEFCQKASQKIGQTVRLPTAAEYEYACRAGTATRFYYGDDPKQLGDYAWYLDNADGQPHPVGLKKPNAWGLYDMMGNAWVRVVDDTYKSGHAWRSSAMGDASSLLCSSDDCGEKGALLWCGFRVVVDLKEPVPAEKNP
jgi:formylglycine-generating enzyme required for sulfatase activity